MNNVVYLRPEYEDTGDECFDFVSKRIPRIRELGPDWLYPHPEKKTFDLTDEELILDVADEMIAIARDFTNMADRVMSFAARLKEPDDAA